MRVTSISCFVISYLWSLEVANGLNRTVRQASCGTNFACISGQCIEQYDVCNGLNQCADGTDELPSSCGCGEKTEVSRSTVNAPGVRYASPGSHPWHAGIYRVRLNHPFIFLCSGTLIYSDIVLTSAYCVIDTESQLPFLTSALVVSLGKLIKDYRVDESQQQQFEVAQVVINNNYDGFYKNYANNLAIIKLKKDIVKTHFVKPVCLWSEKSLPPGVTKGSMVGWGLQFRGAYAINLREAMSTLISAGKCSLKYEAQYRKFLTTDKFCLTLDQGVGVKEEDAGGSVTVYHDGRHYLYGIISKQFGTLYGLGTLTKRHISWIKNTTYNLKQTDNCLKANHFQCVTDGACLSVDKLCDSTSDCSDGSDEDPKVCTDSNALGRFGKKCQIPERIEIYNVLKCGVTNGCNNLYIAPSNSRYQILCPEGYGFARPNTKSVPIACNDGEWTPSLSENQCLKLCKLEGHKSLEMKCTYLGEDVSCHELLKPNTQIEVSCKRQYKKKKLVNYIDRTYCRRDGTIHNELSACEPVCGKPFDISDSKPLISHGESLNYAKYPWHIALYWKEEKDGYVTYDYKCGGTLLDSNKVLTAAHCVWRNTPHRIVEASTVAIAIGKLYRNWASHEGEDWVQKAEVNHIVLGTHYDGAKTKHSHDIAILFLTKDIKLSDNTMPACLDLDRSAGGVPKDQLGHVMGWGSLSGTENDPSNILKEAWMDYMDLDRCRKVFEKHRFTEYLHPDKYCGLYRNGSGTQVGDSGGGMTFIHDGLHYVYGVVSLKKGGQDEFAVFTNVLSHAAWIIKNLQ